MKDLLEKLDLIELFAYLCPGIIVLYSSVFWAKPDLAVLLGDELAKHQLVVAALLIIASYTSGMLVASWSSAGADYYIRIYKNPQKIPTSWRRPIWWIVCFFHALPVPRSTSFLVEGQLQISEGIDKYAGVPGLSLLQNPWDRLATYRTIMSGRLGRKGRPILTEAQWVHRRLLFALGVALAVLIVGLQAIVRLLLYGFTTWLPLTSKWLLINFQALPLNFQVFPLTSWVESLPHTSLPSLVGIGIIGIASSLGLRKIAGRMWEYELLLTSSLTQLDSNEVAAENGTQTY